MNIAEAVDALDGEARGSVPTLKKLPLELPLRELGGDELAASTTSIEDLPYLPLLGTGGWIVHGWSHLLAGYPRVGKTDLTVALVREWLDAGLRVLYITEEPEAIWSYRINGDVDAWSPLRVVFGLGYDPELLRDRVRSGTEQIVIVDAIRNLLRLKDEKDNSEIARVTNPWIADARDGGKTLLMLHHQRKGGGEHGEGIAGGHALMGGFDIAIELLRDTNQQKNRRLLRSYARLIPSREGVYEKTEEGDLRMLGDPHAVRKAAVEERLLAAMCETPGEMRKLRDWYETLGEPMPSYEQCRLAAEALAKQGRIVRDPPITTGPHRGVTHRWGLPKTSEGLERE